MASCAIPANVTPDFWLEEPFPDLKQGVAARLHSERVPLASMRAAWGAREAKEPSLQAADIPRARNYIRASRGGTGKKQI